MPRWLAPVIACALAAPALPRPGLVVVGSPEADLVREAVALDDGTVVSITPDRVLAVGPDGQRAWSLEAPPATFFDACAVPGGGAWLGVTIGTTVGVVRVDADGVAGTQAAWSAPLRRPADVACAPDGGAWLLALATEGLRLSRIRADGTPDWIRVLETPAPAVAFVVPLSSGGAVVVAASPLDTKIVAVDGSGVPIWASADVLTPLAGRELADGRLALTGYLDFDRRFRGPQCGRDVQPDGRTSIAWLTDGVVGAATRPAIFPDGSVSLPASRHARVRPDRSGADAGDGDPLQAGSPRLDLALPDGRLVQALTLEEDPSRPGFGASDVALLELGPADAAPVDCRVPGAAAPLVTSSPGDLEPFAPTWTPEAPGVPEALPPLRTTSLRAVRWCGTGCPSDVTEPGACGSARRHLPGAPIDLTACEDAEDHVDLHACGGVPHEILTTDLGPLADTVLEVLDESCAAVLASDDDGGGGRASRVVFVPPASGTYRVTVRQKDGSTGPGRESQLVLLRPACEPSWETRVTTLAGLPAVSLAVTDGGPVIADDLAEITRLDASGAALDAPRPFDPSPVSVVAGDGRAGLLAAGPCADVPGAACLARLDGAGAVTGRVRLEGVDALDVLGIAPISDDVLAWGRSGSGGWAARTDTSVAWAFAATGRFRAWTAVPCADGGALLAAQAGPVPLGRPLVARVDSGGATTWSAEIADSGGANLLLQQAAAWGDGLLLVLAGGWPDGGTALATLDGVGTLTGVLRLEGGPRSGPIATCPDGGAVVAGVGADSGLLRLGPDGLPAWHARWEGDLDVAAGGLACGADAVHVASGDLVRRLTSDGRLFGGCTPPSHSLPATLPAPALVVTPVASPLVPLPASAVALPGSGTTGAALAQIRCSSEECAALAVRLVSVGPQPACPGAPVSLVAESLGGRGAVTWEWDLDGDGVFETAGTSGAFAEAGARTVTVRGTDSCPWGRSSATDARSVMVADPIDLAIAGPAAHCEGWPCTTLRATPGLDWYDWSTGETGDSICVAPVAATRYSVRAGAGACEESAEIVLGVAACPPPDEATALLVHADPAPALSWRAASGAVRYNLLRGPLGAFLSPDAALTECFVSASDLGGGRAGVLHDLPASSWVIVTASNPSGEGPAGRDSGGTERSARPGWTGCGPWP